MDFVKSTEALNGKHDFHKFLQRCIDSSYESSKAILLSDLDALESAAVQAKEAFGSRKRVHIPRYAFVGVYMCCFMLLCSWPLVLIHHFAPYYFYQRGFLLEVAFVELLTVYIWLVTSL